MNLALAIVALGGCGTRLPPIELDGLSPAWGWTGEATEVTVSGRNFYPSVIGSSFAEAEVERDFEAWIETDPPTRLDVVQTSITELTALVGEGIDPGWYDFTVESAGGGRATLHESFQVTDSRADHLSVHIVDNSVVAGEWATVYIDVMNPDEIVEGDVSIDVDVVVEGEGVEFLPGTLDHQQDAESGLRGGLRNGQGFVTLTSLSEGDVRLTVTPNDPTSQVQPGSVFLTFSSGNITSISVVVDDPDTIVAGAPTSVELTFLDENDNVVDDVTRDVTLYEACNGANVYDGEMSAPETFTFPLTVATGDDCPVNSIVAHVTGGVVGVSQALTVVPAPASALGVTTFFGEVIAGEPYDVYVTMEDEFGNRIRGYETAVSDLSLDEEEGGLGDSTGSQECDAFDDGFAHCAVSLDTVGSNLRITAKDGHGFSGQSLPFDVLPGAARHVLVAPQLPVVQAGASLEVRVQVTDEPGNTLAIDPADSSDALVFKDEDGADIACTYEGPVATLVNVYSFECQFFVVDTKRIVVDMPTRGLLGFESMEIAVLNGDLAQVTIDLGGVGSVEAGETFLVDFVGTDFWGNPYVVQTDPVIEVRDGTASIDPLVVELDAAGTALGESITIRRATLTDRIVVSQGGEWLGSSDVLEVTAGTFVELELDVSGPVLSVGDPSVVLVSAVDAYGNAVPSFAAPADVYSTSGLGDHVTIAASSWVDGRAVVVFTFDTPGLQDTLVVDDGVHDDGESDVYDVLDFGCASGPTADLDVGSGLPLRLCLVAGMGPTSFDLSGSTAGTNPIVGYYYLSGDGTAFPTSGSTWSASWTQPGGYEVGGIAVDRLLCASEATGWVYVGFDDGQPVGPVEPSISGGATAVHALDDWVTVDVSARTCTGDPAIAGTLLASVDIGELVVSAAANSRATGAGIELMLDAYGEASIEWSMLGQPAGGVGTFATGVRSGAAYGTVPIDIEGDSSHPIVLEVMPAGTYLDGFDSIIVLFSDRMQEASVSTSSVVLTDPAGDEIAFDSLALTDAGPYEGRELVATFEAQTGSSGTFTLTLTSDLRKAPGDFDNANTLDGAYTAHGDDYVVSFGAVTDEAPDVITCDPSTTLFRPDGDATGGDPFEADEVALDVVADGDATWWLLEVFDLAGNAMASFHVSAAGLDSGTVAWNGRDNDGMVLANGTYVVSITAKDDTWNEGSPCLAMVAIDVPLARVDE